MYESPSVVNEVYGLAVVLLFALLSPTDPSAGSHIVGLWTYLSAG